MASDPRLQPVIIGVGEIADRPAAPELGLEPAALMAEALRRADEDAGGGWLSLIDSLDVVNAVSWPYGDLPAAVIARSNLHPARVNYGPVGGETPTHLVHEAALRIVRGECAVAAVCGGEAQHTVQAAKKAGVALPWTPPDPAWTNPRVRDYLHPLARHHGLAQPALVYPLYENAYQAALGQSPAQGQAASAALWAALSAVAADNPCAWLRRAHGAEEIEHFSQRNRPIAWPYPKLMVANPVVNQGAAILVTSRARALAAGIDDSRLVDICGGALAQEPRDWVARDVYHRSAAQVAALGAALRATGLEIGAVDQLELYSCFPCVPKMALRALGQPTDRATSVTGGLTFFGAPLNSYMTHAMVAMVRRLRQHPGQAGLLYGQGEFVTKHHCLVLGGGPMRGGEIAQDYSAQAQADRLRGPVPEITEEAAGAACVETFTVLFDRAGKAEKGVVVLRTHEQKRTLARVGADDVRTLDALMRRDSTAIGLNGPVRRAADGLLEWTLD
ncbi:MAG TPA: acetyl-CoA acetyltransferase [Burkholderiales bacterium]|nr:acetyl-CoA acetyltransferase [Burkholderiales bacterium]